MAKRKSETTEYIPEWDDGTYHTGAAKPQKEHRGLIAVLMILVIFLGGIASLLGFANIRLLRQLSQAKAPDHVPLYQDGDPQQFPARDADDASAPSLSRPENWDLPLETAPQEDLQPAEILVRNDASIVSVHISGPDSEAVACGVIMDEAGFLITNAYPISESSRIHVRLSDERSYRATLVGTDEFMDLAVLYIEADGLNAAQFAVTDHIQNGDPVFYIGAQREMLAGSIRSHSADYTVGSDEFALLKTDLCGISGPIFNAWGQIVGFSSPFLSDDDCAMAIPSVLVKDVAEQIIKTGAISGRPTLGAELEEVQPLHQQYWQLPQGLRVTRTFRENSQLQGLETGDILISLNGKPITDRESLCAVMRTLHAGQQVSATVVRGNQTITLMLTIQSSGNLGG